MLKDWVICLVGNISVMTQYVYCTQAESLQIIRFKDIYANLNFNIETNLMLLV